ncbi:MAG TPA: hypothetical protein VGI81_02075 [Tepidisphaeraceae bacterium]
MAICTSFDSGRFVEPAWLQVNGYAVSSPISDEMIDRWPVSHDEYCDEWWVFDSMVPADFDVVAFCNFTEMRIANYKELDFEGACRLDRYLAKFAPTLMFGNNEYAYVVRRSDDAKHTVPWTRPAERCS